MDRPSASLPGVLEGFDPFDGIPFQLPFPTRGYGYTPTGGNG
ncbi:MAG: hypothetical protein ACOYMP_01760 [Nodosilinea sp.]